ncbi:MAG: deoxyribose-phosphate aldolase [Actinomycetota bacterium]|jgi:deoxyribose-phosphate aldolase
MIYRGMSLEQVTSVIDHSVLKPISSQAEIEIAAITALKLKTAALCIRPMDVALAARLLASSEVAVATVIGFPHGTTTTKAKVAEALDAIANGATELDMVLNISALLDDKLAMVQDDIAQVVSAACDTATVKVIFETCYLSREQIATACSLSENAGAHFVKTSTGFAASGATVADIKLMREKVGSRLGVKASGGVKTLDHLVDLVEAGANRVGCSATESIVAEFQALAQ